MLNQQSGTRPVAIVGGRVVTPYRVIPDGVLVIAGERIVGCGDRGQTPIPDGAEIVDVQGAIVGPGFIDIHVHGGGGALAYLDPATMAKAHLMFGTTAILPTTSYNESREQTLEGVRRIVAAMEQPGSSIAGIHLEGPFINKKYGAILSPIRPIDREEYEELIRVGGSRIKLWTFAPELEGAAGFAEAVGRNGTVMSVGHSEATAEEIFGFVRNGLMIGCHTTNACGTTPSPSRYGGTREVGVAEAILVHDDIFAEVIPDKAGVHVRPLMLKLILKAKGADKVIVITDAMDGACLDPDAPSDLNWDVKNQLAGSKLTMNGAVRNMIDHTGVGFVDAFKMASLNPARAMGFDRDMGSLEPGKLANVIVIGDRVDVRRVMLRGQWVKQ